MANFLTVYDGIAGRLYGLGFTESTQATDFKHAGAGEYDTRFILKCLSGENKEDALNDRFYDGQEWQIQIAFSRSEQSDIEKLKELHLAKDKLLKDLDKPANWSSFVAVLKYKTWEVIELADYYILDIRLSIIDYYTY